MFKILVILFTLIATNASASYVDEIKKNCQEKYNDKSDKDFCIMHEIRYFNRFLSFWNSYRCSDYAKLGLILVRELPNRKNEIKKDLKKNMSKECFIANEMDNRFRSEWSIKWNQILYHHDMCMVNRKCKSTVNPNKSINEFRKFLIKKYKIKL